MIKIDYYMSHGSPWTFLGHKRLLAMVKNFDVKLNIYPDGGVARLRVYGQPDIDWQAMEVSAEVDLLKFEYQAVPLAG